MHIKELKIQRFRGFSYLTVKPKGHVVVMGERASGRSDLIEALSRVLDVEANRSRLTTELDFYNQDTSLPIQIEVTLGELGADLQQLFLDHLEFWDRADDRLLTESESPDGMDETRFEWVLRLEHVARWLPAEERGEEWVHYPKQHDPSAESFVHATRRDLESLGFSVLHWGTGRILDLGARSSFRRVITRSEGNDFNSALAQYVQEVGQAAGKFTSSGQVKEALQEVFQPLRHLLGVDAADLSQITKFAPDGGSASGLLRSLGPSFDLGDGSGEIPAWRRGSTTGALLRIAEALAFSSRGSSILAIDDLGDGLDSGASAHLAFTMRKSAGQVWVTTRVPSVAEVFEPQEVVRLGREAAGGKFVRQGKQPSSKIESLAAKHWHRNLLPALSYRSVVVIAPGCFSAYGTFMLRQFLLGISREIEEAALIDGCSAWGVFWHVVVPLAKPALGALAIFTFLGRWRAFLWPLIMTDSDSMMVLPVGLAKLSDLYVNDYGLICAGSVLMLVPMIAVFVFFQRWFISGIQLGAVKG